MTTYLAFLRAINVGGNRTFLKDDIRRVVADAGFGDVETHINTGNVKLESRLDSRHEVRELLEGAFRDDRGFDVPTIVFPADEFAAVADDAHELGTQELTRHYVYLLADELTPEQVSAVEATSNESGRMVVRGRAAHALLGAGYTAGAVDPLGAAKHLGVATNRKPAVIDTMARKWCGWEPTL